MKQSRRIRRWSFLAPLVVLAALACNKSSNAVSTPLPDQYISWAVGSVNDNFTLRPDTTGTLRHGDTTILRASDSSHTASFYLAFRSLQASGVDSTTDVLIYANSRYYKQGPLPVKVIISSYGAVGQYLVGSCSGSLKDSSTNTYVPMSAQFKVKVR